MKIRVYVGTTEGPVAIERITREAAPNSAMCIGRSTREATASAGYEAFVKQPSGVVERELGPYSPGAFRLDVSADIGDGDSWQLGVFVAHALAAEGRLADYHENADAALWLTGEVANDLEVKPVGPVPDKLRASRGDFETLASGGTPVTVIVPTANREYLDQAALPPSITWVAVSRTDEALEAAGLSGQGSRRGGEGRNAVTAPGPRDNTRIRSGARRWGYAAAAVLILAAAAAAYPFAERLWIPKSSEDTPTSTPSIVATLDVSPKPTEAAPPKPVSQSVTEDVKPDAPTPAADETGAGAGAITEAPQLSREGSSPRATEDEANQPIGAPPRETASIPAPVPEPDVVRPRVSASTSESATKPKAAPPGPKPVAAPARPDIRLVIRERRAPSGSNCAAVHFGGIAAAKIDVKRSAPNRFAPSRHDNLCGLEFTIISAGAPAYVAAFTTMISGRFIDAGRAPRVLDGAIPLEGEASWVVDVARRLRRPIEYRLVAVVSDRPATEIATRLRRRADPVKAAMELSGDGVTVHYARHLIDP